MSMEPTSYRRREFLRAAAGAASGALAAAGCTRAATPPGRAARPNILWITVEDMSANLGCWGDRYALTPNLDRLAAQSVRYTNVYATAPVCSPVRSCLITGCYATSLGTMNLRSRFPVPREMTGFPAILRRAGTFCTNNVKTDYNTANEPAIVEASWDACSSKAHWRARQPGQPFFAVFNDMVTHQSRTMVWPYEQFQRQVQSQLGPGERHDPAKAPVPPYYPDTPVIRRTIARTYDCITAMDKHVGSLLRELDDAGVADDTIVFFYSDHGAGLPRHKRALYDSGLHVPLLIRFPKNHQHLAPAAPGSTVDRLVSFVDFPPTVLSLLGLDIPDYMQGTPFLGRAAGKPRRYVYGARDRVDEASDLARSVRDERFLYIRTFMPHLSWHQPSAWPGQGEIRKEITRLAAEGKLSGPQLAYAGPTRPIEELYDCRADPQQLHNLADAPAHKTVLERMRAALADWMRETHDVGFLAEADMAERSRGSTPYALARDARRYPQERILAAADLAGRGPAVLEKQIALLADADASVRYWAAVGLRAQGAAANSARHALVKALDDPSRSVRIEAAGALAALGHGDRALPLLIRELSSRAPCAPVHAARTLEMLGEKARPVLADMQAAAKAVRDKKGDGAMFIRFALNAALEKLSK